MKLIFFGPPGSGKGTQASRVAEHFNIPHISTGDLLRKEIKEQTEIGKRAQIYVEKADWGAQEIHDIVMQLVKNRISQPDAKNGFAFDGFPRTLKQAEDLENITEIDAVINMVVPEEILIQRLTSRRTCSKCGQIYNVLVESLKPKQEGICDKCGGELIQRADETEEMVKHRMEEDRKNTTPVLEYYKNKDLVINIVNENNAPPEVAYNEILDKFKNLQDK